jgi:hypothetical protein
VGAVAVVVAVHPVVAAAADGDKCQRFGRYEQQRRIAARALSSQSNACAVSPARILAREKREKRDNGEIGSAYHRGDKRVSRHRLDDATCLLSKAPKEESCCSSRTQSLRS